MHLALIVTGLLATCLAVFGWLWLVMGFRREGWRGGLGTAALQVSGLGLVWGFLHGAPAVAAFNAAFPPLMLVDLWNLSGFGAFLAAVLVRGAWVGALVLVLTLLLRHTRAWAPGLALAAVMVAATVLGDASSLSAMCERASAKGLTDLRRDTLAGSLARRPGTGPHALARAGAQDWAWSYRAMDWYALPAPARVVSPDLQPFDCTAPG